MNCQAAYQIIAANEELADGIAFDEELYDLEVESGGVFVTVVGYKTEIRRELADEEYSHIAYAVQSELNRKARVASSNYPI